jgi:dihydropteroate synthase
MAASTVCPLVVRGRQVDLARPVLMGIVNTSPDSFSGDDDHDAGDGVAGAVAAGLRLADEGALLLDVGGQSAITGVPEIAVDEELARVLPVVEGIVAARPDVLLSVDTYRPEVVQAVLAAGAALINDVSGLLHPEVAALCAEAGAGLVIMHTRVRPKERRADPALYDDVVDDVVDFLSAKLDEAEAAGLPTEALVVDPGPDFAKTPWQTVAVLRAVKRVRSLGRPVLLALSRKDFVGAITGRKPRQRLAGTLAAIGHVTGADPAGWILRVHDVAATADYLAVADVLAHRADIPEDLELPLHLRRQNVPTPADPTEGPASTPTHADGTEGPASRLGPPDDPQGESRQ